MTRVLVLHSRYRSGALSGENRVVDDEIRLLREAGHAVEVWAPTVPEAGGPTRARLGARVVWSGRAARTVRARIRRFRPDVVHVHNLFPMLSPSTLRAAAGEGAATVLTLHNSRLVCLAGTLTRDGERCTLCVGRLPVPGVRYACYRGSRPASAAIASSLGVHRGLGTFDRVSLYLAVSGFIRDVHLAGGLPADRVRVRSNFAWPAEPRSGPGSHFLFLGRLSPEKGIEWLARTWQRRWGRLVVVGDGPSLPRIRREAAEGVELLGPRPPSEVPGILHGTRALLVPSVAQEAQARVILEAAAVGVPVVTSRTGGLLEAVEDDVSGLHAETGDAESWGRAIERLLDDGESERLGHGALEVWAGRFSPGAGLASLEAAYDQALARR